MLDQHNDDGTNDPVVQRPAARRGRTVLGVVGLGLILGGGSFLVTEMLTDGSGAVVGDTGALAPRGPGIGPATMEPSPGASSASAAPSASPAVSPATSAAPMTVAERVAAAKGTAAKARNAARRPLVPANGNAIATADELSITDIGSLKENRATLRVVSAYQDLSGQRELSWVAGAGEPVGDARCAQNFHFSQGAPAVEKPTLLVCWRTSSTKSVYTVAVSMAGRPSRQASVAALDKRWQHLN